MKQSLDSGEKIGTLVAGRIEPSAGAGSDGRGSSAEARIRVLLVDDEQCILTSLRRLLRREPYELSTATSGEEALKIMEADPAPVIITDYRMTGMTGTELLHEIQQRWPETIRIVLSGYSEVKAILAAINEGAVYKYMTKPWNDEEIKLNIRRALEQHGLETENRRLTQEIQEQNERLRELNEQLDQRAIDASTGQAFAQELLESIDAGVLTIDELGLVVGANVRAAEYLKRGNGALMGVEARSVLPDEVCQSALSGAESSSPAPYGRFQHGECFLQWRARRFEMGGEARGQVVSLWEEIPCQSQ